MITIYYDICIVLQATSMNAFSSHKLSSGLYVRLWIVQCGLFIFVLERHFYLSRPFKSTFSPLKIPLTQLNYIQYKSNLKLLVFIRRFQNMKNIYKRKYTIENYCEMICFLEFVLVSFLALFEYTLLSIWLVYEFFPRV